MRGLRGAPLLGLLSLLGGCPYVSRAELEDRLQQRDDDGDGVSIAAGDCNDDDDRIAPGNEEIPYDELDNDCVDGDLLDVDGDGFDIGLDCDDNDAQVRPDAPNAPYDGVESDCRGTHDYDVDGDGVTVAGIDEAVLSAYEAANDQPTLQRGDCDDLNRSVLPGAPNDVFYDGVDTNCDGLHDFDQDGDGYVLPDDVNGMSPRYDRYVAEQGLPTVPREEWDCDDDDPEVNPGVTVDDWYDGVDANCDGADDFDADLDGVQVPDDCLDLQDEAPVGVNAADVYPDALEQLNDFDMDCREDGDDTIWRDDGLVFEGARSLRIAHVEGRFFLGVLADSFAIPPTPAQSNGFVLLAFDDEGSATATATATAFQPGPGPLSDSLQLSSIGEVLEVGISIPNPATVSTFQHLYSYADAANDQLNAVPQSLALAGADRASVAMDLTADWGWSCGEGALYASDRVGVSMSSTPVPGTIDTCFAETTSGVATVCAGGSCRTFDATGGSLVEVPGGRGAQAITAARRHDGVYTFIDDGAFRIEGVDGPSGAADLADSAADSGFVVAIVEDGGLLSLRYGPAGATSFSSVDLAPGGGAVVDVAVAVSAERVFAAVLTSNDALRWASWAR